jgi:hypothetical protein
MLGWAADRFAKPPVLMWASLAGTASFALLASPYHGHGLLLAFVMLFAICDASAPTNWAVVGEYFGSCTSNLRLFRRPANRVEYPSFTTCERGSAMVSDLFFYQLGLIALVWLCLMLQWAWPSDSAAVCPTTPELPSPVPKRHREPTPFAGLTTKPHCDACEHSTEPRPQPPSAPPPRLVPTRGRRRQVDTAMHFCPNPDCT